MSYGVEAKKYVVCSGSKKTTYVEGDIVSEIEADVLRTHGGIVMPCESHLYGYLASGYVKYHWGRTQIFVATPKMVCPVTLNLKSSALVLNWVMAIGDTGDRKEMRGGVQLSDDTRVLQSRVGNVIYSTKVDFEKNLTEKNFVSLGNHWVLQGNAKLAMTHDGNMGVAMYGWGHGFYVKWIAFCQSK
jgi:hypothetical protein